jgi:hypothetical protein
MVPQPFLDDNLFRWRLLKQTTWSDWVEDDTREEVSQGILACDRQHRDDEGEGKWCQQKWIRIKEIKVDVYKVTE